MASRKMLIESELLLIQHRRGKPDAFEKLVGLWEKPLYYYVRRLVKTEDIAKDVTQDIWLNVIRKINKLREPAVFPAWLYKIARNQTVNHFRKEHHFDSLPKDDLNVDPTSSTLNEQLFSLGAEELHSGLSQLSPPHSECLMLHYLEGFSLEEMSGIVGIPVGTIKSRIHYAKKSLRILLEKEKSSHEE